MEDRVTLETIARDAGVSQSTVSRVLNQPALVNARTRQQVYAAIEKYGYAPQGVGRAANERKHVIGVAIHDFHLSVFADLFRALEDELAPSSYDLMIINMRGERDVYRYFRERVEYRDKIDALIAFSVELDRDGAEFFRSINMPVVLMQSRCSYAKSISTNNFLGGHDAAVHLLERGYRRIGFIGWEKRDHRLTARFSGFRTALEEAGIDTADMRSAFSTLSVEGGYEATEALLESDKLDGIFYACDSMAIGGLRYLRRHGVRVPDDIGVVGFDDIEAASAVGLTTMQQFIEKKASMGIEYLLGRLEGRIRETEHEEVSVSPRLVQRETTR